jgi:prepilin signal peptidase PulO-like enzyme (type II secretory pathway)
MKSRFLLLKEKCRHVQNAEERKMTELHLRYLTAALFLGISGAMDLRHRTISAIWVSLAAAVGICWDAACILLAETDVFHVLFSLMPGAFLVLTAFAVRGKLGYGDGICLMTAGLFIGAESCFYMLCGALLLSALAGTLLVLSGRRRLDSRLPFLPFCFAAFMIVILVQAGG